MTRSSKGAKARARSWAGVLAFWLALPALAAQSFPVSLRAETPAAFAAPQATGAPDTQLPGPRASAWAPAREDAAREWLELVYARAVTPVAVRVFESCGPGAIDRVTVFDAEGRELEGWSGFDPTPVGAERGVSLLPLLTDATTTRVRLYLDPTGAPGWNQIDAVALHDLEGGLQWATRASASSARSESVQAVPEPASHAAAAQPQLEWDSSLLQPAWRTPADRLLELFRHLRAAPGADVEWSRELAREIVEVQRTARSRGVATSSFGGSWRTTFGWMQLHQESDRVAGVYRGGGTIHGRVASGRLTFQYAEEDEQGEGWFELSGDGRFFSGEWRPLGEGEWSPWEGFRREDLERTDHTWLVVLEAPWQDDLSEPEYSFGAMLASIFAASPDVSVRHRFFDDGDSFRAWCSELGRLPEPIVLCIATHATVEGLACRGGTIPPEDVAEALQTIPGLRLVHFSACEAMSGPLPDAILEAHSGPYLRGVSGYATSVDWMGSALIEFLYFDLLLNRKLEPERAARAVLSAVGFAGEAGVEGVPLEAAHFRFRPAAR